MDSPYDMLTAVMAADGDLDTCKLYDQNLVNGRESNENCNQNLNEATPGLTSFFTGDRLISLCILARI
jgi:hypothetical protein